MKAKLHMLVSATLLILCMWQWGQAGWIYAKAQLAQYLINKAWQTSLVNQQSQPPWDWADTWPVARLQAPDLNVDLAVLAGADGSALAFGPGHLAGTALPGAGASVIGGHRDTHFSFLQDLQAGDRLRVQDQRGHWHLYRVTHLQVVDSSATPLLLDHHQEQITLVTCYPFKQLRTGGPWRYLVTASKVAASHTRASIL